MKWLCAVVIIGLLVADVYLNFFRKPEVVLKNHWWVPSQTPDPDECVGWYYAKAVELDPQLPEANNNYGSYLVRSGQPEAARKYYEAAIRHKPDNYEAMSNLGSTYATREEWGQAEMWYRRSIQANPNSDAYNNLGTVLARTGRVKEGLEAYREALRLNPDNASARKNLDMLVEFLEKAGVLGE